MSLTVRAAQSISLVRICGGDTRLLWNESMQNSENQSPKSMSGTFTPFLALSLPPRTTFTCDDHIARRHHEHAITLHFFACMIRGDACAFSSVSLIFSVTTTSQRRERHGTGSATNGFRRPWHQQTVDSSPAPPTSMMPSSISKVVPTCAGRHSTCSYCVLAKSSKSPKNIMGPGVHA